MKKLVLLILVLLMGCAGPQVIGQQMCRHNALINARIAQEKGYEARIAVGPPGHGQAQAFINGKWEWLCLEDGWTVTCEQDKFFPNRFYTVKERDAVMGASYRWR